MVLSLCERWVWDSWYIRDGDLWHCFFLQADKSIGDPELRHWHVSYGHATSHDLVNWDHLGTCFGPSNGPAWDDYTTWTGSVVRGDDDQWHLFYTGTSHAGDGKHQKLGHAVSDDLHNWRRVGDGLILDRDERYEEFRPGRWHDRAFRDPWVIRDPDGDGWLMFFTARDASVPEKLEAGAIGLATSPDIFTWTLQDPVFTGGFGELEVPQVLEWGGQWYCLFCTGDRFWSETAKRTVGEPPVTGTHYLIGDSPRGPWRLAPGPILDGSTPEKRYAARIVDDGHQRFLLGFLMLDPETGAFPGIISDPVPVVRNADGILMLETQDTRRTAHG
ncbi:MAG: levansucrase [Paracoccaceae bacterium]|nr:levansucrase [Paracoccaceae bacterium]